MLKSVSEEKYKLIIELRQQLHRIAEPSMQEYKTKALLMEFLHEHTSLEVVDCGSWFYALHKCDGGQGPIAFRADFDAVVCQDGCARHLCGHDGHSAILAGLGLALEGRETTRDAFFGMGCGEQHAGLHTATYEFNDAIIEAAVDLFIKLVE